MTTKAAFTYAAAVVRVVDGDTVVLDVDLGFRTWIRNTPFRLAGINCAERGTPGGDAATAYTRSLLGAGDHVTVTSVKTDKYDRYDAQIILADGRNVSTLLVAEGYAAAWDGRGVRPVPPWPIPEGVRP